MSALKLVFNMLIFPGGLFAIMLGMLLMGVDRKLYARIQRRVGPPLYQPFIDLVKLLQKEILVPQTANYTVFRAAPLIGFIGMLAAAVMIPISGVYPGLDSSANLLVLLYLLATPALALMIGASASGSPYSAIGYSREMSITIAYEAPLLVVLMTVAMKVGMANGGFADFSLGHIISYQQQNGSMIFDITMLPALLAFLCCIPATIGTVPFDIPEAETELAEGPLLEYSGSGLAMYNLTGGLKMVIISALAVALFFPGTLGSFWLINLLWFVFKCLLVITLTITVVRATRARMRMDQALKFYLTVPVALALVSLVLTLLGVRI
ncbi:MAG TPA: complex I subunit 1 family protein [Clostridia bacterium]|nr:complex I subunit 1 family protein [Clostridia bacterium]